MPGQDFEAVVAGYYEPLYRFAISLTRSEADACDLAQQTFYMWATKGHQLRDPSKVKSWLFTTLHRAFLESRRTLIRFPHCELTETDADLPVILPEAARQLDAMQAVEALGQVDEVVPRAGGAVLPGGLFLPGNRRDSGSAHWHRQIPHGARLGATQTHLRRRQPGAEPTGRPA